MQACLVATNRETDPQQQGSRKAQSQARGSIDEAANLRTSVRMSNSGGGRHDSRPRIQSARVDHAATQPPAFTLRVVEAGFFASLSAGRTGRRTSSPPQLGQRPPRTASAQERQKV